MKCKEGIRLVDTLLIQSKAGSLSYQYWSSHFAAHLIADTVAKRSADRDDDNQRIQIEQSLRCKKSGDQDQAFTRYDHSQKSSRFQHGAQKNNQVVPITEAADKTD